MQLDLKILVILGLSVLGPVLVHVYVKWKDRRRRLTEGRCRCGKFSYAGGKCMSCIAVGCRDV